MPRIARVVVPGYPHHITQRGNYQQEVFITSEDRFVYLDFIKKYSVKYELAILAYCFMQNHVHFIAIPGSEDSLARVFNTAHMRYAQYFNKKAKKAGHLWQGRFFSCVLNESHLLQAVRYVERNPVRAGLAVVPFQWPWSSVKVHTMEEETGIFSEERFLDLLEISKDSWKEYVSLEDNENFLGLIRKQTLVGRPLGEQSFVQGLELKLNRSFSKPLVGRPPKSMCSDLQKKGAVPNFTV